VFVNIRLSVIRGSGVFGNISIGFAELSNSDVLIPLFLAEPLTIFCGTLRLCGTLL
jgi:hypothetical protein